MAVISVFSSTFSNPLVRDVCGQSSAVLYFPTGVTPLTAYKAAGSTALLPGCCLFLSATAARYLDNCFHSVIS